MVTSPANGENVCDYAGVEVEGLVADVAEKGIGNKDVPDNQLRRIVYEKENVRGEVHDIIPLPWDKVYKTSNEDSLKRVLEVLGRSRRHRSVVL